MSWIDTALVRDSKADLPSFTELLAKLPVAAEQDHVGGPLRGRLRQRHREAQTPRLLPGLGGLFRWLKPLLSTPVGENAVAKTANELLPRMDEEVAALGRSTSAVQQHLGES